MSKKKRKEKEDLTKRDKTEEKTDRGKSAKKTAAPSEKTAAAAGEPAAERRSEPDDLPPAISSGELIRTEEAEFARPLGEPAAEQSAEAEEPEAAGAAKGIGRDDDAAEDAFEEEVDPVFRELAEPKLPDLPKDNRARLQMQSPTRAFLYWSFKNNPYQTLSRVFGDRTGSYTLVAKLTSLTDGFEEIFPVEPEGSWWFNVNPDSVYQAEIGFYAPNRPFIRIMFSNVLQTPRRNPSPRPATDADWAVTAMDFAEVLDSTGYTRDAFEVALAGDDPEDSDRAAHEAFARFLGAATAEEEDYRAIEAAEIRFALLALAAGASLEELRGQIGERLFAILEANAESIDSDHALASLQEYFDIWEEEEEEMTAEEIIHGAAVFGASLVNFPQTSRRQRRRRTAPKSRFRQKLPRFGRELSPVGSAELVRGFSPISSFDWAE